MINIYIKNKEGQKIYIEVSEDVAIVMQECRRAEWRNEAKEKYYRGLALSALTDDAIELKQSKPQRNLMVKSPEEQFLINEKRMELYLGLKKKLDSLTGRQYQVLSLLYCGFKSSAVAKKLGVSRQSINDIKKSVQKKFLDFLK